MKMKSLNKVCYVTLKKKKNNMQIGIKNVLVTLQHGIYFLYASITKGNDG